MFTVGFMSWDAGAAAAAAREPPARVQVCFVFGHGLHGFGSGYRVQETIINMLVFGALGPRKRWPPGFQYLAGERANASWPAGAAHAFNLLRLATGEWSWSWSWSCSWVSVSFLVFGEQRKWARGGWFKLATSSTKISSNKQWNEQALPQRRLPG